MGNKIYKKMPAEAGLASPASAESAEYQKVVGIICKKLEESKKAFIEIGWCLNHIKKNKWYLREDCRNIYQFAKRKFQISQSEASRLMNLCTEFSVGNDSVELDKKYKDFSFSQLVEMLTMKREQREKITPDITVRQIRKIKKELEQQESK